MTPRVRRRALSGQEAQGRRRPTQRASIPRSPRPIRSGARSTSISPTS